MPVADYLQYQRSVNSHSAFFRFFSFLVLGGFFIGTVEVIAYIVGLLFKTMVPNHSTEPSPTSGTSAAGHPPRQP